MELPAHASVVVIGGGVMGCSTLYHLAKAGVSDAVLLERNKLTSGTTWHSAAQVRALRASKNLTDLIDYSISLYSSLEAETGQSTGWINKGSLSIATSPDRLTFIKRQEALAHLYGVAATSISAAEAKERWPMMNADDVLAAVWSPADGRVGPSDLCAALAKGAKSRGAKIFEDTGVIAILTRNNKIVGLETTAGSIRCEAIALCTGLWSRKNAKLAGVDIPVWPCEHFYLLTNPVEGIVTNLPTLSDHDNHLYIRDDSGGLLVGCFEPMGKPIDPERIGEDFAFQLLPEDWDHFEPMLNNALHRLPCLETAEVRMLLNGPESFTPDGSFLLGESAETQGLFLGCGMNSVGVATGGGAGMALAHCIVHGHTPTDLHEADPKRFPDCFNSVAALSARIPEILGTHYAIHFPGVQLTSARGLRKTPLHQQWLDNGAQFGQFYGWERPLYFNRKEGPILGFGKADWFDQVAHEVDQAHNRAAIFDQSTFGKIAVEGRDAEAFLNRVCANNMAQPPGKAIYTALLNRRGGFESDLTALRLDRDKYRLYVGTAAIKRDLSWLKRHLDKEEVQISDVTENFSVLGLMGPKSTEIITQLSAYKLIDLPYFHHCSADIRGIPVDAVRLSYVGESGWEITCAAKDSVRLYDLLYQAGARPAGIFAQSSMRIEKRFLAYGHDLDTDINPLQAGLGFAIDWQSNFIGKQALLNYRKNPTATQIVSLVLHDIDAVPLGNEPVYYQGEIIGKTTSAAFGYRIGKPVAIALINSQLTPDQLTVEVDIARVKFIATITTKAAFDADGTRMRIKPGATQ
ncbi:MAG: FAD-dependent oxidoreductase [Aestuariibacter sp.]|nr:FAD-dependent oxidoreductase [Aestuariibacter sp.]